MKQAVFSTVFHENDTTTLKSLYILCRVVDFRKHQIKKYRVNIQCVVL